MLQLTAGPRAYIVQNRVHLPVGASKRPLLCMSHALQYVTTISGLKTGM